MAAVCWDHLKVRKFTLRHQNREQRHARYQLDAWIGCCPSRNQDQIAGENIQDSRRDRKEERVEEVKEADYSIAKRQSIVKYLKHASVEGYRSCWGGFSVVAWKAVT